RIGKGADAGIDAVGSRAGFDDALDDAARQFHALPGRLGQSQSFSFGDAANAAPADCFIDGNCHDGFPKWPMNWRKAGEAAPPNISSGVPELSICPCFMNTTRFETLRANPISWVTTSMVIPSSASERMTRSTSPTSSGSSAEVGSSKSM